MTSYTSVEALMVDSVIMIPLDKEEREKTHLIHRAIAEEQGVDWEELDLTDVVRMIYITGMEEFDRMCDRRVKFHEGRFFDALMRKEGEE